MLELELVVQNNNVTEINLLNNDSYEIEHVLVERDSVYGQDKRY